MKPELKYVMTYWERIEGPMPPTRGSAFGDRICWQIKEATLKGENMNAHLVVPGADWMRLGKDGIRRADNRVQLLTDDGETILFYYDNAIIKSSDKFLKTLQEGKSSDFKDQYMRMSPVFEATEGKYSWLEQNIFIGSGRFSGEKQIEYEIFQVL